MLSELSYQHLRFEGRAPRVPSRPKPLLPLPERLKAKAVASPLRPGGGDTPLTAAERRLVAATLAAAGVDSAAYRAGPLRRRLPALLRALRSPDADTGTAKIAADPRAAAVAVDTLLIGHTEPFRDEAVFAELRSRVLPQLAAGRWGLNVWSVGCSTGAELMSVALLLAERGIASGSRLRGADCRPGAIDQARRGAAASLHATACLRMPELAPWLASPGFVTAANRVEWVVEDALDAAPGQSWDLILCRNLAIYLDPAAANELWRRLADSLPPGGVLVTGKAERPPANLPLTRLAKCLYRREEVRA